MRRVRVEELESGEYRLLLKLAHGDILSFVQKYYLQHQNWLLWLNYALNLACLVWALGVGVAQRAAFKDWLFAVGWAVVGFVVLIPVHEAIHGLAYLLLGARDVRFGGSLRMAAFYALANDFVVRGREFVWVALAPFLAVNGALLILALASPGLRLFAATLSFLHLSSVGGDWAMLGFLWENRNGEVYTYDDAERRLSYFYQKAG